MNGVYRCLSPFAADYSGVCSALYGLGGAVLLHGPTGCAGAVREIDEPRSYDGDEDLFSSAMSEMSAVMGSEEALIDMIIEMVRLVGGRFAALVGTPLSAFTGVDLKGVARATGEKLGLPVFAFDTNGFENYASGVKKAYIELAQYFLRPGGKKIPGGVNVLGATPLDVGTERHLGMLLSLLKRSGLTVVSVWTMGASLEDLEKSSRAKVNLVVSQTGLSLAKLMESKCGIPYVCGVPVGRKAAAHLVKLLQMKAGKDDAVDKPDGPESDGDVIQWEMSDLSALIIGEPVLCSSIRRCLARDFGVNRAVIASMFPLVEIKDTGLLVEGDVYVEREKNLEQLINCGEFSVVVGDPYYRELLLPESDVVFVPIPHTALSGRNYWNLRYDFIGEKGLEYLGNKILGGLSEI